MVATFCGLKLDCHDKEVKRELSVLRCFGINRANRIYIGYGITYLLRIDYNRRAMSYTYTVKSFYNNVKN